MVNEVTKPGTGAAAGGVTSSDEDRALVLAYAPPRGRGALAALLALDDALARLLATTREPALGLMRLVWWRDALARLDAAPAPAEPVLQALAAEVLPLGVPGSALAGLTEGWEVLVEDAVDEDGLRLFAAARGGRLFALAGQMLGASRDPLDAAGQGWALADLARHLSDTALSQRARALAAPLLDDVKAARWSRGGRPLGALAHLARLDLAGANPGQRIARIWWHWLSGR